MERSSNILFMKERSNGVILALKNTLFKRKVSGT